MKKKMDIYLNVLIIIMEVIGLVLSIRSLGAKVFLYYTQDSNLFLMFTSLLYLITYNKKDKKTVGILKYGATLSVLITFIVVVLVLKPTMHLSYHWLLFEDANLYYHTLCPILGVITFIFFDKIKISSVKDNLYSLIFTFIYTVIFLALNIMKVIEGPYPFLMIYKNPIWVSIMWFIVIDGGAFLLAKFLESCKRKQTN